MIEYILILIGLVIRYVISMGGYSGQGDAPLFGDYEVRFFCRLLIG